MNENMIRRNVYVSEDQYTALIAFCETAEISGQRGAGLSPLLQYLGHVVSNPSLMAQVFADYALSAVRQRLDDIAEHYDIVLWEGVPDGIRYEFEQLTAVEQQMCKVSFPLQLDIDALNDPNYND